LRTPTAQIPPHTQTDLVLSHDPAHTNAGGEGGERKYNKPHFKSVIQPWTDEGKMKHAKLQAEHMRHRRANTVLLLVSPICLLLIVSSDCSEEQSFYRYDLILHFWLL